MKKNNKVNPSKIKYTTALPSTLIINGLDKFGYELAKSLSDQGGMVIIVDNLDKELDFAGFEDLEKVYFIDFTGLKDLIDDIRRLDYVFYLNHNKWEYESTLSSQEFLAASNYLNQVLNLADEFEALFLLTNSIRAHKLFLNSTTVLSEQLKQEKKFHSYTEAEFVRYSENLVLEFQKNKNVETKIARLGEIIGDGIELSKDTNIGKLVWNAINENNLYLDEDGLESEYYVHLIDAVYGVIKLQFTKKTKEEIYTIAYKEPITQLNLAYKIQEIEVNTGEIKFVDETQDTNKYYGKIAIYKAAPNLTEIGWQPKIQFEKALVQTIAYAKKILKIYQNESKNINSNTKNNALKKLIEERQKQKSLEKKKYESSLAELEIKKRKKSLGWRMKKKYIRAWDKWKKNILFLKDLTLAQTGLYMTLILFFLFIFFTIFAPIINFIKDVVLLNENIKELNTAVESHNWEKVNQDSITIKSNLESIKSTINSSDFLFLLIENKIPKQELLGIIQSSEFMTDSLENLSLSIQKSQKFFEQNDQELVYRPTNSSVLSVNQTNSKNYDSADLIEASTASDIALRSLETSQRLYNNINKKHLPKFILENVNQIYNDTQMYETYITKSKKISEFLKKINRNSFNIGLIVQDNIQTNYNGGNITSLGIIEYKQGKINSIKFMDANNVSIKNKNIGETTENQIKKLSINDYDSIDNIPEIKKFNYIFDQEVFLVYSKNTLEETFSKNIDAVWVINLNSFYQLLDNYGEIIVNEQTLSQNNYLQVINLLQKNSIDSRNTVITNINALLLANLLDHNNESLIQKITLLNNLNKTSDMQFSHDLEDVFEQTPKPKVKLGLFKSNPEQYTVIPSAKINQKIEIDNTELKKNVTINTSNTPDADKLLVCFDKTITKFKTNNLSVENFSQIKLGENNCLHFNLSAIKSYQFDYLEIFDNDEIKDSIMINPGAELEYDIQIKYPSNKKIISSIPEINQELDYVFYSGEVYNQFKFYLKFN